MKRYQAILTNQGAVDIGEFQSLNLAKVWALQQYGAAVSDVVEASDIVVDHEEIDPIWFVVGIAGLLLLFAGNKKRKKKRGPRVYKQVG